MKRKNKISIPEIIIFLIFILVLSLFTGFSALGLYAFGKQIQKSWESVSWMPSTATIISHPSEEEEKLDEIIAKKKFLYGYIVNGTDYKNDTIRFGLSENEIESRIQNLKKNQNISIYYNPDNPKESVVENAFEFSNLIYPILFFVFCFLLSILFFSVEISSILFLFGKEKIAGSTIKMFFGTLLAIFTFIPLSFVSFSAHEIYKGIQSNTWKKTNGKILSIRTISDNHSTKHSNTKVFYQYASGGKTYTNSKISYLKEFPYIGEEFDTFNLYNSSDSVSVFLNPDTKEESVLIQGTGIFPFFVLLLGVCFSNIFGFWFAIYIDSHKTLTKKISPQKQRSVLFTSFFLPFLAVALRISFLGFQNVYIYHLAENWPITEATIIGAHVHVQDKNGVHQNISDRTRLSQYIPKIEYSYRIENKEYIGNRIQIGGIWSSSNSSVAEEILKKYENRSVWIHYNPKNPTESYLERSGVFSAYSIGIISGLFSVFVFLILIRIWKIKK
ncbi:DUF3592 domain-containing protein [Leptospira kirschneri]|uniref:DUF3592 domain-containing protein n=1 Tax=Leptospira kirschneri TaxID=29507 RepID=UPI000301C6E5|nr:DUF3592 domain-containing protein [Leptospira kirschneri]